MQRTFITALLLAACAEAPPPQPERAVLRDTSAAVVVASDAPAWREEARWRLSEQPTLRIEVRDDAPELSPVDPVAVFRTARGEIVVADGNQAGWHRLLVYDAGGRFVRHLGRAGEGPCEFGQVWQAWPFRGDSVAVFDMARGQVAVLALDSGCGRAVRLPETELTPGQRRGSFVAFAAGVYPDGSMLMAPSGYVADTAATGLVWYESELRRVDRSGTLVRSLGVFPIMQTWRTDERREGWLELGRFAVRAIDGFDLLFGDAGSFEILRIDTTGAVRQILRRPHEPQRVTRRDQELALSRRVLAGGERGATAPRARPRNLRQRIARANWPDAKPAYSDIIVDARGNVWVQHHRIAAPDLELTDTTAARWSVFDRAGTWLGEVATPGRLFVRSIYDDAVLGIWQHEDGVRSVRAYALMRPH